jgi:hypothetical protein
VRRAEVLLAAWNETSIIETIFSNGSLSGESEFVEALRGAAREDDGAYERLTATAAILLPYLLNPRGPKISAASAAHEFFLEAPVEALSSRAGGYTWRDLEADFVDEQTEATRREFTNPDFDPRPAYRRVKMREAGGRSVSGQARKKS